MFKHLSTLYLYYYSNTTSQYNILNTPRTRISGCMYQDEPVFTTCNIEHLNWDGFLLIVFFKQGSGTLLAAHWPHLKRFSKMKLTLELVSCLTFCVSKNRFANCYFSNFQSYLLIQYIVWRVCNNFPQCSWCSVQKQRKKLACGCKKIEILKEMMMGTWEVF